MVTIKRKVTIKTKKAIDEPHTAGDSHEVTIKRKLPEQKLEPTNASVTQEPEKKSNTNKIIGGIVATAAILVGIYFFAFKGNGDDANVGTATEQTSQVGKTPESRNAETAADPNTGDESATTQAEGTKPSETNDTPVVANRGEAPTNAKADDKETGSSSTNEVPATPTAKPYSAKQATTPQATSAPMNGNVEENARKVIRGDFGNGQTRKDKLGSSYAEIQGKVNEMYRQGLVH